MDRNRIGIAGARERRCSTCNEWFLLEDSSDRRQRCPDHRPVQVVEEDDCVAFMDRRAGERLFIGFGGT